MTIRKLLALLQPYAVGAEDGAECEVTIDDDEAELVINIGSDIHRLRLNNSQGDEP